MIRRNVIGIASAVVLLTAAACGDNDNPDKTDSAVADAGGGGPDSGTNMDGGVGSDASVSVDSGSTGEDSGSTEQDAAALDATTEVDAQTEVDAATEIDAATQVDAQTALDAEVDSATADSGTPGPQLPALVGWYKFDETSGTTASNSSGELGAATLMNGASFVTGKHGNAVSLAGGAGEQNPAPSTKDYVKLPSDVLDRCTTDITVAMWIKLDVVTNWSRILELDSFSNGFLFMSPTAFYDNKQHLHFNIWDGTKNHGVSAEYPAGTDLLAWHHVAFTQSAGTGHLYLDGQEIGSAAMEKSPSSLNIVANSVASMGRSSTHGDAYIDGAIDDLRVSCTAYSAEQMQTLFNL